jgi:hypothetical protein
MRIGLPSADEFGGHLQKRGVYLRKPPFYPLNYGDRKSKSKKAEGRSPASALISDRVSAGRNHNRSADECGCV